MFIKTNFHFNQFIKLLIKLLYLFISVSFFKFKFKKSVYHFKPVILLELFMNNRGQVGISMIQFDLVLEKTSN
jgi:hypothetical protein